MAPPAHCQVLCARPFLAGFWKFDSLPREAARGVFYVAVAFGNPRS